MNILSDVFKQTLEREGMDITVDLMYIVITKKWLILLKESLHQ